MFKVPSPAARVAMRYAAARPMKPEKMQALLLKLRKGAESSLRMPELVQVLDYLGGYKLEEDLVLQSQEPYKGAKKAFAGSLAQVKTEWEEVKANEVSTLPTHLVLYKTYYQEVDPIVEKGDGTAYFKAFAWRAVMGVKVMSPNHKVFQTADSHDAFLRTYPQSNGLLKWLKKETPYLDQINEKLSMPTLEEERLKKIQDSVKNRTTENMGTCPACFGHFKLVPRNKHGHDKSMPGMVLHGYKRPGTGYITGNCFGQDWPPFELSKEGTDALVIELKIRLDHQEKVIAKLKSGKVEILHDRNHQPVKPGDKWWDSLLKEEIASAQAAFNSIETILKICERQLTGWEPTALPGEGASLKFPMH